MSLRPLTPDGRRPKRSDELNEGERHHLKRQKEREAYEQRNLDSLRDRKRRR